MGFMLSVSQFNTRPHVLKKDEGRPLSIQNESQKGTLTYQQEEREEDIFWSKAPTELMDLGSPKSSKTRKIGGQVTVLIG